MKKIIQKLIKRTSKFLSALLLSFSSALSILSIPSILKIQIVVAIIMAMSLAFAMPLATLATALSYGENDEYNEIIEESINNEIIGVDVILLMDVSGSMRFSDPQRKALEAAIDFVDALPLGTSRLGIIGFSGIIQYHLPLQELTDENMRNDIRSMISRFQYVGFADIGRAMMSATNMLADAGPLTNPMIVLITDGGINISPNEQPRVAADSYADVELALNLLERRVPVYTIGIVNNPDTSDGVELLDLIALLSGGHTQLTNRPQYVPNMFVSTLDVHIANIPNRLSHEFNQVIPIENANENENYSSTTDSTNEQLTNLTHDDENNVSNYSNGAIDWQMGMLYGLAIISAITATGSVIKFARVI